MFEGTRHYARRALHAFAGRQKLFSISSASFFLPVSLTDMNPEKPVKESIMQERDHCLSCKRNLSAYIDKELPPSLMAEAEAHLASCPSCRAEFDCLCAVKKTLAGWDVPEPRYALDAAVMSRITQTKRHMSLRRLLPAPVCAAALGLFVGVFLANGTIQRDADTVIAPDDGIMRAMDAFSPSPQSSFSSAYFSMINNPGR